MKKIISLMLALALCMSLAACGRNKNQSSEIKIDNQETEDSLFLLDESFTIEEITFSYPSGLEMSVREDGYLLEGETKAVLIISEELPEKIKGYQSLIANIEEIGEKYEFDTKETDDAVQNVLDTIADSVMKGAQGSIKSREYTKINKCSALKADCIFADHHSRAAFFFTDNYIYMFSIIRLEEDEEISYADKDLLDDILESVTLIY